MLLLAVPFRFRRPDQPGWLPALPPAFSLRWNLKKDRGLHAPFTLYLAIYDEFGAPVNDLADVRRRRQIIAGRCWGLTSVPFGVRARRRTVATGVPLAT
jgi:hypothetical protein